MGASTRPLAEDLTCNSTLSSNIPFSTYSDLYYKERFQELKHLRHILKSHASRNSCRRHGRLQRLKIARSFSTLVNNWDARRGRWAYSVEKYHWMLKIISKGALSDFFPLVFLKCSPNGCVKQALSLCSVSKQSTGERLLSTFDFDSCFSCSFSFSLSMPPPPFIFFRDIPFYQIWCKVANDCVRFCGCGCCSPKEICSSVRLWLVSHNLLTSVL